MATSCGRASNPRCRQYSGLGPKPTARPWLDTEAETAPRLAAPLEAAHLKSAAPLDAEAGEAAEAAEVAHALHE